MARKKKGFSSDDQRRAVMALLGGQGTGVGSTPRVRAVQVRAKRDMYDYSSALDDMREAADASDLFGGKRVSSNYGIGARSARLHPILRRGQRRLLREEFADPSLRTYTSTEGGWSVDVDSDELMQLIKAGVLEVRLGSAHAKKKKRRRRG